MSGRKRDWDRCDGVSRREVLRVGGLTAFGLSLETWFRRAALAAGDGSTANTAPPKSCILIWLDGGPSHLETFDLKPDAPSEVRGPFSPIATNVPGVDICQWLPRTAQVMDRVALVRSMTSSLGEHNFASHYLLTGYKPNPVLTYPSFGSVVARERARAGQTEVMPPYVAIPDYNGMAGRGYLPAQFGPFAVGGDPAKPDFAVRDLELFPEVTAARLHRRREFAQALDAFSRGVDAAANSPNGGLDPELEQAYRLTTSAAAKQAFDLSAEPASVRDRYGRRTIGQSCLLARRLIEAGVPFVTVNDRGWDTHEQLVNRLREGYTGGTVGKIPSLDLAFSALVEDLSDRGLLDQTLVIVMGEFGRTPKLNTRGGRDHWPRVFSVALAGGGVRGGAVVGGSDTRGESPADDAVTPADLAKTVYTLLSIDPDLELHTGDGRPVRINADGQLVKALFA